MRNSVYILQVVFDYIEKRKGYLIGCVCLLMVVVGVYCLEKKKQMDKKCVDKTEEIYRYEWKKGKDSGRKHTFWASLGESLKLNWRKAKFGKVWV